MSKVKKIYLDMDGVFCDFDARWFDTFGRTPKESRNNKEFSPDWEEFITGKNFTDLPWTDGGKELFEFILSLPADIQVEMLTSSGGKKFHDEVKAQKKVWLCDNGFPWKANVVPGRGLKKQYATPDSILIDDTYDVIEAFDAAGGVAIWHKNASETIGRLKELMNGDSTS